MSNRTKDIAVMTLKKPKGNSWGQTFKTGKRVSDPKLGKHTMGDRLENIKRSASQGMES